MTQNKMVLGLDKVGEGRAVLTQGKHTDLISLFKKLVGNKLS